MISKENLESFKDVTYRVTGGGNVIVSQYLGNFKSYQIQVESYDAEHKYPPIALLDDKDNAQFIADCYKYMRDIFRRLDELEDLLEEQKNRICACPLKREET